MTAIDTTIQFIMNTLKADSTLVGMVDNKIITELPRSDITLNGTHKSVIGMTIMTASQSSYFVSQIREYLRSEITAQVSVLTGYEQNDSYCRAVVARVRDCLQDAQYIGLYRIFINSAKYEIKADGSTGKWAGNLTLDIVRFDPIV
jgi:hypothetical protein